MGGSGNEARPRRKVVVVVVALPFHFPTRLPLALLTFHFPVWADRPISYQINFMKPAWHARLFCALLVARVPPLTFIGGTIDRGHIWLDELGCLHGTGRANIRNLRENETKTQTKTPWDRHGKAVWNKDP